MKHFASFESCWFTRLPVLESTLRDSMGSPSKAISSLPGHSRDAGGGGTHAKPLPLWVCVIDAGLRGKPTLSFQVANWPGVQSKAGVHSCRWWLGSLGEVSLRGSKSRGSESLALPCIGLLLWIWRLCGASSTLQRQHSIAPYVHWDTRTASSLCFGLA